MAELSDVVGETQQGRKSLGEVLKIQQKEREEGKLFERKCLFCKKIIKGRDELFRHMFSVHGFNAGHPDNLVNFVQFLNLVDSKIQALECIYCKRKFLGGQAVLRRHMRKKKHFKISSSNKEYDPFYVVNYMNPTDKELLKQANDRDQMFEEDESKDEAYNDWSEEDAEAESAVCLFCTKEFKSFERLTEHLLEDYNFNLVAEITKLARDYDYCYSAIKIINFIRAKTIEKVCIGCGQTFNTKSELVEHMKANKDASVPISNIEWKDEKYLHPTLGADDKLLQWIPDDE